MFERFEQLTIKAVNGFTFAWPKRKDDPENTETYSEAYQCLLVTEGKEESFVFAYGSRFAADMEGRARMVVFQGTPGQVLYPLLEFAGGNSFAEDSLMASVIFDRQGKTILSKEALPPEYAGFYVLPQNEIIIGRYAKRGLAVVCGKYDFVTILRHALIRKSYG
jgi:hypothetical protein